MAYDPGNPSGQPAADPFADWYKNTIQANPGKYDPAHFSEGQARAWFPLWDPSSGGFRSSKVDAQGNPIQGNTFTHPDECPAGMQAFGANSCVPVGSHGTGGGGYGGGGTGTGSPGGDPYMGAGGFGPFKYTGMPFPEFQAPTGANEMNDPGYQFRLQQGQGALEASAAARGVLNTGGTLEDILKYGQNYASQEYGNVFQRAKDMYAPQLAHWQSEFQRQWDAYQFAVNDERAREQMMYGGPSGF